MSDQNSSDERPRYTWLKIEGLIESGVRGNLLDALNDARRHLVWFARERGVRVGYDQDGSRHWSLPSAIRKLARDETITASQEIDLLRVVDIRDDEIHHDPPADEDLIWATKIIATVCGAEILAHSRRTQSFIGASSDQQEERTKGLFKDLDYPTEIRRKFWEAKSLLDSMNPLDNLIAWGKQKILVGILANTLYKVEHPEKYEKEQRERQKEREEATVLERQKSQLEEARKHAAKEREDAVRRTAELQRKEQQERRQQRFWVALFALAIPAPLIAGILSISKEPIESAHVGTDKKMADVSDADIVYDATYDTPQRYEVNGHDDNVDHKRYPLVDDVFVYLEKDVELQFGEGDDPAQLLKKLILKHCDPVPVKIMKATVAADGTELACANHLLPTKILPGMKLYSPRAFNCPSSSSVRNMKSVRAEFCAGLK